ncbi:unannotated protein [freshwater metagenome]|uniref:Unannotated protein n=1 Tax=freshwater metagenome TaxID=449393 RepID=A0A6J6XZU0_9ZZZZ
MGVGRMQCCVNFLCGHSLRGSRRGRGQDSAWHGGQAGREKHGHLIATSGTEGLFNFGRVLMHATDFVGRHGIHHFTTEQRILQSPARARGTRCSNDNNVIWFDKVSSQQRR